MTHRITLPGDIPGLLVPSAPVVRFADGRRGIVHLADGEDGRGPIIVVDDQVLDGRAPVLLPRRLFGLDLQSPAGQWAAARWAWGRATPDGEHAPLYSRLLEGALLGRAHPVRLREALLRRAEQDGWVP